MDAKSNFWNRTHKTVRVYAEVEFKRICQHCGVHLDCDNKCNPLNVRPLNNHTQFPTFEYLECAGPSYRQLRKCSVGCHQKLNEIQNANTPSLKPHIWPVAVSTCESTQLLCNHLKSSLENFPKRMKILRHQLKRFQNDKHGVEYFKREIQKNRIALPKLKGDIAECETKMLDLKCPST